MVEDHEGYDQTYEEKDENEAGKETIFFFVRGSGFFQVYATTPVA